MPPGNFSDRSPCDFRRDDFVLDVESLRMCLDQVGEERPMPLGLLIVLQTLYLLVVLFGACGSSLVIFVVARRPPMRTRSNLFIMNLAISDLSLCLFSQPYSMANLFYPNSNWHLGTRTCKAIHILQATNVFVSTISITVISIDRLKSIVQPTRNVRVNGLRTGGVLLLTWLGSFLVASPLSLFVSVTQLKERRTCTEKILDVRHATLKLAYSVCAIFLQYLAPLITVSLAYTAIIVRMRKNQAKLGKTSAQYIAVCEATSRIVCETAADHEAAPAEPLHPLAVKRSRNKRRRRTMLLLASIALIFAVSWLPINIVNIVGDVASLEQVQSLEQVLFLVQQNISALQLLRSEAPERPAGNGVGLMLIIAQAVCLILVSSSACSNPVLYGWLNENFRREFRQVWLDLTRWCQSIIGRKEDDSTANRSRLVLAPTICMDEAAQQAKPLSSYSINKDLSKSPNRV